MLRIGVFSDIHGNCVALDAVLADLRQHPADSLVCLGDAIQGGPQPAETVARLRELACPVVMGNADAWLLSGELTGHEDFSPDYRRKMEEIRRWSLSRLTESDRAFIAAFQPTVEVPLTESRALLCFHGSPASFDDFILPHTPEEEFRRLLRSSVPRVMTGGHTHLQQLRRLDDTFFFNPGSVGRAYNHQQSSEGYRIDPWAEYAVLMVDGDRLALEFRRVPFDVDTLVEVFYRSGRPYADEIAQQYGR